MVHDNNCRRRKWKDVRFRGQASLKKREGNKNIKDKIGDLFFSDFPVEWVLANTHRVTTLL